MKTLARLGAVAIVLLVVYVTVVVLPQQIREDFVSSSQRLMQAQNNQGIMTTSNLVAFDTALKNDNDNGNLDDSGKLLLLKRCYQTTVAAATSIMSPTSAYSVSFHEMFSSMQQIEDRIVQEIAKFNTAVKGNIYVMISQVPYFKNERGNPIYASYYIDDVLNFQPASTSRSDIYYSIAIIFANYDASKKYSDVSRFETSTLPSLDVYASNDKQCFIRCIHSSNACGCASSNTGVYPDDTSYITKCFGRSSPDETNQLTEATFTILYTINMTYPVIRNMVSSA